ncbi:phage antirepressor KilAC domain-containing protein [Corynebacterium caspium]|uniref:phage antirepressor KilAC domain-containing protein n=1 Tax=Corynebacterium caspium TaxID=234828 RepID=UPI000372C4BB|nr:phage antirepressor KilAC domain-containing protein [Corynebacterium caspium]WKD58942.1 Phage antirepressor protein KilAC domain protein [Corynebacterium caspium DSM 44850]
MEELISVYIVQIAMGAETECPALDVKTKELESKDNAYDKFLDTNDVYPVGAVAKMLGKGRNSLFQELRDQKVLISDGAMRNTPYQKYMHHFEVKPYPFGRSNGGHKGRCTTYVKSSGIDFIRTKLQLSVDQPISNGNLTIDEIFNIQ